MALKIAVQSYPRIEDDESDLFGYFDDTKVVGHYSRIPEFRLKEIIRNSLIYANSKSSRAILEIPESAGIEEIKSLYENQGGALFKYFIKYCGDPASTALECIGKHYSLVARDQFRNRTLQKERMNAGWRYQFIAKDAANLSGRFNSVSDVGAQEADFNATIKRVDSQKDDIFIYVSVKNRMNTMGGQDWPKAIRALEDVAKTDKNRKGPYLCVFGIAMEKGVRKIRLEGKSKSPFSFNTEVWLSDYFWPFFTNYSYEEIIKLVYDVLVEVGENSFFDLEIPEELISSFGDSCRKYNLLDSDGNFNDAYKLINIFCGGRK